MHVKYLCWYALIYSCDTALGSLASLKIRYSLHFGYLSMGVGLNTVTNFMNHMGRRKSSIHFLALLWVELNSNFSWVIILSVGLLLSTFVTTISWEISISRRHVMDGGEWNVICLHCHFSLRNAFGHFGIKSSIITAQISVIIIWRR